MKLFTLFQLQQFEGYDLLKDMLNEAELQIFYNTPKSRRAMLLVNKVVRKVEPKKVASVKVVSKEVVKDLGTQMCTFNSVLAMANEHMLKTFNVDGREFNMREIGVHLEFNTNKSRWGFARRRRGVYTISLSKWMIENTKANMDDWIDTMLHEMAHIIDYIVNNRSDHSARWVRIANIIGCKGERTLGADYVDDIVTKYSLICDSCGKVTHKHKAVGVRSCGNCSGGKFNPDYKLRVVKHF